MKQETKPLYKALNVKITQGIWKVETIGKSITQPFFIESEGITIAKLTWGISEGLPATHEEVKANAEYIALAVNNIHILAEAIENLLGFFDNPVMRLKGFNDFQKEAIQTAKEALNRIS